MASLNFGEFELWSGIALVITLAIALAISNVALSLAMFHSSFPAIVITGCMVYCMGLNFASILKFILLIELQT